MGLSNFFNIKNILFFFGLSFTVQVTAAGNSILENTGISLSSTRVIYPGDKGNGITYTLTNNSPYPYLLQSKIIPWGKDSQNDHKGTTENTPFIVLPPLVRFEPESPLTLRIRLTKNILPKDRESVFLLTLNAIPAQQNNDTEQNSLVMSTQNNLKLFYRPSDLPPLTTEQIGSKLEIKRSNGELIIKNPTPFYVTLNSLSQGMDEIDLGNVRMIEPFSEKAWVLKSGGTGGISLQLITDDGSVSEIINHP